MGYLKIKFPVAFEPIEKLEQFDIFNDIWS